MATPPLKPSAPPPPVPQAVGSGVREPQISVIPDSYYGVALQLQPPFVTDEDEKSNVPVPSVVPKTPPPAPVVQPPLPPEHHSRLWFILLLVFVFLAAGGGWVAWNRDSLFGKKPTPPIVGEKPAAPNAPTDLTAVSTAAGAVRLNWQDRSQTEAGFRVERKGIFDTAFVSLQTLPAGSQSFFDPSAAPGVSSTYRVFAFNPGGDSLSSNDVQVLVLAPPPAAPPAPTLPPDGLDSDSDGLTNTEEIVYGANGQLPDTDGDGYLDGNEVFNLYAPTVRAPSTLLSLPTMQTVSSTVGWQTILPKIWTIETSTSSTDVRARTVTGEVFVFHIEENATKQPIRDWLFTQKRVRADQVTELLSNKFKVPFYLGPDRLTAYILWEDRVLVVSYQLGSQTFVNYRTSFGLMLNALRLTGSPKVPDLSQPVAIPPEFQTMSAPSSTVPVVAPAVTTTVTLIPPPAALSPTGSVSSTR